MITPFVLCLMGPTASGKTALATALAARFPLEIISVDSAMIYRGMDIGTAKPTAAELIQTPHHLIDIINPPDSFSAADFCKRTQALCDDIIQRGKIPFLVGGTMMYFHAFQQGLSALPEADAGIRARIIDESQVIGWEGLHRQLQQIDANTAAHIHANDTQRIQRALEVFYLTGKPLSQLLLCEKNKCPYPMLNIILEVQNRAWLHDRIARRFDEMLAQGFVDEVAELLKQWPELDSSCPAMRCVGYRQAIDFLKGEGDATGFREKAVAATRQLAKRQLTWLRSWPHGERFFSDEAVSIEKRVIDWALGLKDEFDSRVNLR